MTIKPTPAGVVVKPQKISNIWLFEALQQALEGFKMLRQPNKKLVKKHEIRLESNSLQS